jgi:LAS superfamily LD-carboxypeptidase LdcB
MLLTVVDSANPLDKDYVPDLETVNGFRVNRDALKPLENLLKASKENGTELKIKTAYVSYDEQEERFQSELQKMLQSSKYTTVRAEAEVLKTTPHGGQSESQTGLLVEFDFSNLGSKAFLERNCVEYGFVQRYTESKTSVTRMNPSDSLYRYVGIENAKRMRSYGMCLEEYKSYLQKQAIPK